MQQLVNTLESCGYKVFLASNKNEALDIAKSLIKSGMSIGLGGSVSVDEIGLLKHLTSRDDITLFNQYESGISMVENKQRRKQGMLTDLYITGTNALSRQGHIINADGSGNRVAAMIFGPVNVLLIVGKNKVVDTLEDGQKRVLETAAIKNIDRMNNKAIENGKEPIHNINTIAQKFTYIKSDEKNRIIIILIDEELGY